jgi:predicted outer membrane repeat protein
MKKIIPVFFFKHKIFLLLIFILSYYSISAQTSVPSGLVSGQWTLSQSPYIVEGPIVIAQFTTLSIEAGVHVIFYDTIGLIVHGSLLAIGNASDSIFFDVNDTSSFADTNTIDGGWGGIRFYDGVIESVARINYCVFTHAKTLSYNDTLGNGAAIYAKNFPDIQISNSRFSHNTAIGFGGAIYYGILTNILIDSCLINENISYNSGGGIANIGHCNSFITNCKMVNNRVLNNQSTFIGQSGGAFYSSVVDLSSSYNPILINNYICNNYANNGGGIYESTPGMKVVGNIICNNKGDGIFCGHSLSVSQYTNNTICNNGFPVKNPGYFSAGITTGSEFIKVKNNIIWGNWGSDVDTVQIKYAMWGQPSFNFIVNNNIQYGDTTNSNISCNPFFVNPSYEAGTTYNGCQADWSLADSSISINAGNSDTTGLLLKSYDIKGNPRWYGVHIDQGTIENQVVYQSIVERSNNKIEILVFPNPATDVVYLKPKSHSQNDYYELYDTQGRMLKSDRIYSQVNQIYLGGVARGVYTLIYYSENGRGAARIIRR